MANDRDWQSLSNWFITRLEKGATVEEVARKCAEGLFQSEEERDIYAAHIKREMEKWAKELSTDN